MEARVKPTITKAVILAAGRGSRMNGFTQDRPKCLLEIGGRALIDWQIDTLRAAGIGRIAVVRGYRGDLLADRPVTGIDNPRWADTNMVRSLLLAERWMGDDDCLVSYGDIVYAPAAVGALMAAPGAIAVLYDADWERLWRRRMADPLDDAESFRLGPDGAVADIGRKPVDLSEIEGQYMGLIKLTPAGRSLIRACLARLSGRRQAGIDMTGLLRLLVQAGVRIDATANLAGWIEVDTPGDLALGNAMIDRGELNPGGLGAWMGGLTEVNGRR